MPARHGPKREPQGAFTLIEIVIAVAILAILAGIAIPVASKAFDSKARRSTRTELEELADSAAEYFRDTFQFPTKALDLLADPGVAGWRGPYVLSTQDEDFMGTTDYDMDAWRQAYQFATVGDSKLEIASSGGDGAFGDENDLEVELDATPIRREVTLDQLDTINQAIALYNARHLPDEPLPTTYGALLDVLVAQALLPDGTPYAADGWGDAFVADPPGKSPVVRVASTHLSVSEGSGSGSTGGAGKGKGKDKGNQDKGKKGSGGSGGSNSGSSKKGGKG